MDCVFIYFKYWQGFTTTKHALVETQMQLIGEEYTNMLEWLHSVQFADICSYLGYDAELTRSTMLDTLHNPKTANRIAALYDIRIPTYKRIAAAIFSTLLILCLNGPAQAIPNSGTGAPIPGLDPTIDIYLTQQPKIPETGTPVLPTPGSVSILQNSGNFVQVNQPTALTGKKDNLIPVLTPGAKQIRYYKITVYSYRTTSGGKIDLPFKVKGVKSTIPSPTMARVRLFGKKMSVFQPILNAAGSIAQICTMFLIRK
jgi:hypothetical protein